MARPPIRLRNSWKMKKKKRHSWKSSCPSELRSNLFIMRSRTPGSFWFFVKAPSSVFMKIRNSALKSLLLLPSLPACFWKTAIRDSMHRSVSIGLDTFAMSERSEARGCKRGAAQRALTTNFLLKYNKHFYSVLNQNFKMICINCNSLIISYKYVVLINL